MRERAHRPKETEGGEQRQPPEIVVVVQTRLLPRDSATAHSEASRRGGGRRGGVTGFRARHLRDRGSKIGRPPGVEVSMPRGGGGGGRGVVRRCGTLAPHRGQSGCGGGRGGGGVAVDEAVEIFGVQTATIPPPSRQGGASWSNNLAARKRAIESGSHPCTDTVSPTSPRTPSVCHRLWQQ